MAVEALIRPDWAVPGRVHACATTREGGSSEGVCASLNLGAHVSDAPDAVARNRSLLREAAGLPAEPRWLEQVHGTAVVELTGDPVHGPADAAFTRRTGEVCAILTADCLPVLLADAEGTVVAAAHAGWRGLSAGVLEATVSAMDAAPGTLRAWLGPAIGPAVYEVGAEVRAAFIEADAAAAAAFVPTREGHWHADLYALARQRLQRAGVSAVTGGGLCTFTDARRFFSFRRDGSCGRMATLIWLEG